MGILLYTQIPLLTEMTSFVHGILTREYLEVVSDKGIEFISMFLKHFPNDKNRRVFEEAVGRMSKQKNSASASSG